jgi:poly[ADP-ribose] polymerase 16
MAENQNVIGETVNALNRDIEAANFLLCLVWSSAHSYRFDSVLRPFPSDYTDENGAKDISALRKDLLKIPKLVELNSVVHGKCDEHLWSLLHWILQCRHFQLEHIQAAEWSSIIKAVGRQANQHHSPTQIFRVVPNKEKLSHFEQLVDKHGCIHAFHGSKLENFYSILNYGLLGHMNKSL